MKKANIALVLILGACTGNLPQSEIQYRYAGMETFQRHYYDEYRKVGTGYYDVAVRSAYSCGRMMLPLRRC